MFFKTFSILFTSLILNAAPVLAKPIDQVLNHYADIALASYGDSLDTAKTLQLAIDALAAKPSKESLLRARDAWLESRIPYQQTEVFRFGNSIVDDWEGKVNAWPLDEGLIDYVVDDYSESSEDNPYYTANVIASKSIAISGSEVDTSSITPQLLEKTLHEADGVEANVATGYHAIEFLLWGQDLNGTKPGAGKRLFTDFDIQNCSNKNCDRRVQYLKAASELLVTDLEWMVKQWEPTGDARSALFIDQQQGLAAMLKGMGSLSYGELAGERIKLGLMLHDPEEEHDCFSDNTHNSHFYNIKGIQNVYLGRYVDSQGKSLVGASLSGLLKMADKSLDAQVIEMIDGALKSAQTLVDSAEVDGIAYDQLLAKGNDVGNQKIMDLVHALLAQTKAIEAAVNVLLEAEIEIEGSDSLDSPEAVFE